MKAIHAHAVTGRAESPDKFINSTRARINVSSLGRFAGTDKIILCAHINGRIPYNGKFRIRGGGRTSIFLDNLKLDVNIVISIVIERATINSMVLNRYKLRSPQISIELIENTELKRKCIIHTINYVMTDIRCMVLYCSLSSSKGGVFQTKNKQLLNDQKCNSLLYAIVNLNLLRPFVALSCCKPVF